MSRNKNFYKKRTVKKLRLRLTDLYIDRVYLKPVYFNFIFLFFYKLFVRTKKSLIAYKKKIFLPLNLKNYLQEKRDLLHFSDRAKVFYFKNSKKTPYYLSVEHFWVKWFSLSMPKKLYRYFKSIKNSRHNYLKKKFLIYYTFYKNHLNKFLEIKKKKFKTKFFFFYVKSKRNKILQKYYNIRFFFSNFSKKNFYRKILYFYQFYSRVFFFKNKTSLRKFFIFKKFFNSKKSYYKFYYNLNNRLISLLFNFGLKNSKFLLKKGNTFINGRKTSFKNIILKKNDLIYFNLNSNKNIYNNFLFSVLKKDFLNNNLYLNKKIKKNMVFLLKNNNFFFENNLLFFNKNLNGFKYFKFPKYFYLKIFKKLSYLKHKNYPLFKEMKLRRNKYFKFKYLLKSRKLNRNRIQNIFKKYKILYKYKDSQDSRNIFFRKARMFDIEKRKKTLSDYNESVYRRLKS